MARYEPKTAEPRQQARWAEADAKPFAHDLQLIRTCYDPKTETLRALAY